MSALPPTSTLKVDALLEKMTLPEKIGQMTQVEKNSITPAEAADHHIGSILSGGGGNPSPNTPTNWANMVKAYIDAGQQTRLSIPMIYGVDAVHGHNNVVGAVIFPHNIGLGAANDADLVRRVAHITTREVLATHVRWNFAPCVAVAHDLRWGRTYEAYSEQTDRVTRLGEAYLRGTQEEATPTVLASVKHYLADGGTTWGSSKRQPWLAMAERSEIDRTYSIDQGRTYLDEDTLRAIHLPPYEAAIQAGAKNIMVSFSSWQDKKMHAHHYLLTDVLKGELGFDGFLVSDWMAINQIHADNYTCVVSSINAGLDMIMVPFEYKQFITDLTQAVKNGDVPMSRIDDAVRRILQAKVDIGLFTDPYGPPDLLNELGSPAHRAVAREAVRKSLVLLKNDRALPLAKDTPHVRVAGEGADDLGLQCGGWTIEWLGGHGDITDGTTLLEAMPSAVSDSTRIDYHPDAQFDTTDRAAVGLLVISEEPYAEGMGDTDDLTLSEDDVARIHRMRAACDTLILIIYSGRPLIVTDVVDSVDAIVAAWLPGSEGHGLTDVLFGDYPFRGTLSFSWPRSMDQIPLAALADDPNEPLWPMGFSV